MWKEYFIYTVENTALTAGTGIAFETTSIKIDSDSDFLIQKRTHVATDDQILAKFRDDALGRYHQNEVAADIRSISGTSLNSITPNGFSPFILAKPQLIKGTSTLTAEFADFSTSANAVRMSLHGSKWRPGDRAPWDIPAKAKAPFDYTETITLTANNTASLNIPINIDSHFVITKIMAIREGAATITVKDASNDRQWMDRPVHIDNFAGNSQFPNILPSPRFVQKGSIINMTLQDLSGSSNAIRITYHGYKLFPKR